MSGHTSLVSTHGAATPVCDGVVHTGRVIGLLHTAALSFKK